jgi:hypothetical protein
MLPVAFPGNGVVVSVVGVFTDFVSQFFNPFTNKREDFSPHLSQVIAFPGAGTCPEKEGSKLEL